MLNDDRFEVSSWQPWPAGSERLGFSLIQYDMFSIVVVVVSRSTMLHEMCGHLLTEAQS